MKKLLVFPFVILLILLLVFGIKLINISQTTKSDGIIKNVQTVQRAMKISSTAFTNNQPIPKKYTCDGEGINPPLNFLDIPANAKSLTLIMHDPDAPMSGGFTHWVLYNIPTSVSDIQEYEMPQTAVSGKNSAGTTKYIGPCPPSGTHHYEFKLYSLDSELDLQEGANKQEVEQKMQGHIIEQNELVGLYSRQ